MRPVKSAPAKKDPEHLTPAGKRCRIRHPLDKPCPKWTGRNYP